MKSRLLDENPYPFNQELIDDFEISYNISKIVIPFSEFFSTKKKYDIYSGNEEISFEARDPEYKLLILQEFLK